MKGLHAKVSNEAHAAWTAFRVNNGIQYTAFIEVLGRRGPATAFDPVMLVSLIAEARAVAAEPSPE